ncbi:MAG: hypothetical protein V3V20_04630 [Algisphaera sp.]
MAKTPSTSSPIASRSAGSGVAWSQLWQLPVLGVGLLMLGLGVYLAKPVIVPTKYGERLDVVEQYLVAENVEEARTQLNALAELGVTQRDRPIRARYRQYLGDHDALEYDRVYPVPVNSPGSTASLEQIDEHYATARDLGRTLDDSSKVRWAQALVRLGRDGDALAVIEGMGDGGVMARYETLRGLIERHRQRLGAFGGEGEGGDASVSAAALARLTDRFEDALRVDTNDARRHRQRQWLVSVRAQAYLDAHDPHRGVDYINRETQRLRAAGAQDDPRLVTLLAAAYQDAAEYENAQRLYALAQQMLNDGDPLNARVFLGQAELELALGGDGYDDRARALFTRAVRDFPLGEVYIDALLGQAHSEAMQRMVADAIEHFGLAIDQLVESTPAWDPRRKMAIDRIAGHVDLAIDLEAYGDALDYLALLKPLFGGGDTLSPRMLNQFAEIHANRAQQYMDQAQALDPRAWAGPGEPPENARRTAFQEAVFHFTQAADYYRRHAAAVTVIDDEGYGESLWQAAKSYDRAEKWDQAIDVYGEYVANRPGDGDGRQLEARHRLGLAYLADRQYVAAADVLETLSDENPSSNWAYASLVPMAHAFRETEREDKALRVLLSVVDGHPGIRPESDIYRDALIDLSRLYYDRGQDDSIYFASAIERLATAVERYGVTDRGPELRYMLADALRKSSGGLRRSAGDSSSERERVTFKNEADDRLRQAEVYFDQVITELEARFADARTDLEMLYLRNAYFFKADCAYDRENHGLAIERYREAAQRFSDHPAALVAQVQIVNAHCALGQFPQAYVANQNALYRLSQMPDEVFDRPDMPMTRRHWEDWLRWSNELKLLDKPSQSAAVSG